MEKGEDREIHRWGPQGPVTVQRYEKHKHSDPAPSSATAWQLRKLLCLEYNKTLPLRISVLVKRCWGMCVSFWEPPILLIPECCDTKPFILLAVLSHTHRGA